MFFKIGLKHSSGKNYFYLPDCRVSHKGTRFCEPSRGNDFVKRGFAKRGGVNERGVTLVELLLVTGVISILISGLIMLINPLGQIGKTNDAKRKSDLAQLQRALETYYQDKGKYPQASGTWEISEGATTYGWGTSWPSYMTPLPKDPTTGRTYVYYTPINGQCANYQCYFVYTSLQRDNDPQACNGGVACASLTAGYLSPPATNACGGTCNYGVSSPNVVP